MTRTRTTLFLLLAVLLLSAYIFFVDRGVDSTQDRIEQARHALRIEPARITSLRIATTNYVVACSRATGGWMMHEPVEGRGDDGAILRVLQHLADLPRGEVITEEDREAGGHTLEDYGLVEPVAEITFRENGRVRTLYLGGTAPVGGARYVMESNHTDVVATEAPIWDYLPGDPSDLRSRRLVHLEPHRVQRLDVRRPSGFLKLTRDATGAWTIEQPITARADAGVVNDLLNMLCRVEVQRFVADGAEAAATHGLTEPEVEISLWTEPEDDPLVVRLGSVLEDDDELVYASSSDRAAVVGVGRHTLLEAGVEPDLLRDRQLFDLDPHRVTFIRMTEGEQTVEFTKDDAGSWALSKPRSRNASDELVWGMIGDWVRATITTFIADGVTNAAEFGLEPPDLVILLASEVLPNGADSEEDTAWPNPDVLVRIDVARTNEGPVRVRLNEGSSVYGVSEEVLGRVRVDPLAYFDRAVLSVLPDDVLSITIENGRRQSVARDESGVFVCGVGQSGTVVGPVVTNILSAVSDLRVALFAAENPESLAPYGLEVPAHSLTLGLTGGAGISKTLLFGADLEPEHVFAMIRGQDTVFILSRTVRDRLVSDICVEASPDEEEPLVSTPSPEN